MHFGRNHSLVAPPLPTSLSPFHYPLLTPPHLTLPSSLPPSHPSLPNHLEPSPPPLPLTLSAAADHTEVLQPSALPYIMSIEVYLILFHQPLYYNGKYVIENNGN